MMKNALGAGLAPPITMASGAGLQSLLLHQGQDAVLAIASGAGLQSCVPLLLK